MMKKQGGAILFSILVFAFLAKAKPKPQPPGIFKSCNFNDFVYADGLCDDELNTPECGYDGGDCCTHKKDNWDAYCEDCECHIDIETFGLCDDYDKEYFQDGECDASMNNPECLYDGGDCCRQAQGWDEHCQVMNTDKCQCLDPFYKESSGEIQPPPPPPPGMFKSCNFNGNDFAYADGLCDDELNTPECGYDGGDCCTHKKDDWDAYCKDCQCHTEEKNFGCDDYDKDWFQDGECDAALNNPECFYDGGDCCKQAQGWDEHCQDEPDKCQCLDPFLPPESAEAPSNIPEASIAVVPIFCNDDEFERNGECVKRIKSQGNNKPFDLSIFGR